MPNGETQLAELLDRWPRLKRWAKTTGAIIAAVGVAAAGIGYLTSGAEFFSQITGHFHGRSEARALVASADERLSHKDYPSALALNGNALKLSPHDKAAHDQQLRIVFRWLENAELSSAGGPSDFAAIADPLKAVLIDRLGAATGSAKADIQAHIGWANFLRTRDGAASTDVAEEFDAAIAEDPVNFYGHLMRGFWTAWRGGDIAKADADFEAAMRNDVDPAYGDRLVMGAFVNITTPDYMVAALTHADAIRQAGRDINDSLKQRLMFYYFNAFDDNDLTAAINKALAPKKQILLLNWLKQGSLSTADQRLATYFVAVNEERDGGKDEALRLYGELEAASVDKHNDEVALRANGAITRLKAGR